MEPNFKKFHGQETGDKLYRHSLWIAERFERMNEQLLTLSSTFIGFLAIELGLFGQIHSKNISNLGQIKFFGLIGMLFLVSGIISFFVALFSKKFEIPDLGTFQAATELTKAELDLEPLRLMVSSNQADSNIQKSLQEENLHINTYYKLGLILGAIAQVLILITLIALWL